MKLYALTTNQGTAAKETGLCSDDVLVVPALELVIELATKAGDIRMNEAAFVDVTGNSEIACIWCGRTPV